MKAHTYYCLVIAGLSLTILLQCRSRNKEPQVRSEYKTRVEYRYDTVREFIPLPQTVFIDRTDTVYRQVVIDNSNQPGDTIDIIVELPIERKEYRTKDYYVVIEGYRSSLLQLDIYREIPVITNTEIQKINNRRRFGIGLQAGYGFNGEQLQPYIGIGVQYNLFSW